MSACIVIDHACENLINRLSEAQPARSLRRGGPKVQKPVRVIAHHVEDLREGSHQIGGEQIVVRIHPPQLIAASKRIGPLVPIDRLSFPPTADSSACLDPRPLRC